MLPYGFFLQLPAAAFAQKGLPGANDFPQGRFFAKLHVYTLMLEC
jgi:hypothetical protein